MTTVAPNLPQLFRDPGECHAEMLSVFAEVMEELAAEGIHVDVAEFLLRASEAWVVWKRFAPQP